VLFGIDFEWFSAKEKERKRKKKKKKQNIKKKSKREKKSWGSNHQTRRKIRVVDEWVKVETRHLLEASLAASHFLRVMSSSFAFLLLVVGRVLFPPVEFEAGFPKLFVAPVCGHVVSAF
jgi:hypothetical protein